jgi:uncharacterized membrane protein
MRSERTRRKRQFYNVRVSAPSKRVDPTSVPLPMGIAAAGWAVGVALLALAAMRAPWRRVVEGEAVHVWYGGIFVLVVLASLRATVAPGFTFHLLGVAAFTLAVGPRLALAGGALALAIGVLVRGDPWAGVGVAYLTLVALPVGVVDRVLRFSQRVLPPNFFVYVFVATFLGAWLSYLAAALAGAALFAAAAPLPTATVFDEYVPYFLYLAFGEATLTGMAITLAVVYRPRWVATFDDARYLRDR